MRGRAALVVLLGLLWPGGAWAALPALPFVPCPSDGMSGPVPPPDAPPALPRIPAAAARQLALYASGSMAVLAPRGWNCLEEYGSGGAVLLVVPHLDATAGLPGFGSLAGPAIEFSFLNGENSGREQVAAVFARLFPFKRQFIHDVESDADLARHFPRGPYPADSTVRRSRAEVDFTTPAHHPGMGTYESRMKPGNGPIFGTARLAHSNGVDSVALLQVRLPSGLRALAPTILHRTRLLPDSGP